ncbi:CU044_5270 family protein [Streptomyces sp. G45]|uniref:CU044_5270 family protein n=1 Tax=Streptomyces sp. G45 TaxID=3406627 RepID=UPI003C1311DB
MKSHDEATDLDGFPAPRERDLPPGRHLRLKEHLLSEIREHESETASAPAKGRRRWLRPSLAAGAVAAAVAAGLVVAQPFGGDSAEAGPPSKETVAMLEEIAAAARTSAPGEIRDDQFVYIKSKISYREHTEDSSGTPSSELSAPRGREIWLSVDGKGTDVLHEPEKGLTYEPLKPEAVGEYDDHYRSLQKLPTDPVNMLDWLNRVAGEQTNGKPFVLIGDLARESLMPPKQAAAMYLAATRIPGVELVDDAVDAVGRHGVAVSWEDDGERTDLIFDRKTKQFLGERTVETEGKPDVDKGEVSANTAVLERTVVDKAGQRP